MRTRGFTLVELVMVIVITGILAASITVFLVPAVNSYFDTRRRAELTDMADTALRRMSQDIRSAVPNSIRSVSATCFQMVPTITGGRYRMADDTGNPGTAEFLDVSTTDDKFDVLSPMATEPAVDDWVVIDNQNGSDVYSGTNRAQIGSVATPAATAGLRRITLTTATQFSPGYAGGRFVVVPNATKTVLYSCRNNVLYRKVTASFGLANTTACDGATNGAVVATDVAGCTFVYSPNSSATQESGFVSMSLQLSRSNETVTLVYGTHVDNVP